MVSLFAAIASSYMPRRPMTRSLLTPNLSVIFSMQRCADLSSPALRQASSKFSNFVHVSELSAAVNRENGKALLDVGSFGSILGACCESISAVEGNMWPGGWTRRSFVVMAGESEEGLTEEGTSVSEKVDSSARIECPFVGVISRVEIVKMKKALVL
jgi:hypothetical protein